MRILLRNFRQLVNFSGVLSKYPKNFAKTENSTFLNHQRLFSSNSQWGSNKKHRNIKIGQLYLKNMSDSNIEVVLEPLRAAVKEQVSFNLIHTHLSDDEQ